MRISNKNLDLLLHYVYKYLLITPISSSFYILFSYKLLASLLLRSQTNYWWKFNYVYVKHRKNTINRAKLSLKNVSVINIGTLVNIHLLYMRITIKIHGIYYLMPI